MAFFWAGCGLPALTAAAVFCAACRDAHLVCQGNAATDKDGRLLPCAQAPARRRPSLSVAAVLCAACRDAPRAFGLSVVWLSRFVVLFGWGAFLAAVLFGFGCLAACFSVGRRLLCRLVAAGVGCGFGSCYVALAFLHLAGGRRRWGCGLVWVCVWDGLAMCVGWGAPACPLGVLFWGGWRRPRPPRGLFLALLFHKCFT